MSGLIFFTIGAFTNRFIRGGNIATKIDDWANGRKHANTIKFIVSADFLNVLVFLASLAVFSYHAAWHIPLIAAAMWVGAVPTWGQYLGNLVNDENIQKFTRNKYFDWLPNKIKNRLAAGLAGMTLRGLFWGGLLALATWTIAPLFIGLFMGAIYLLSDKISEKLNIYGGWTIGEFIFGGLLWLSVL